MRSCSLTVADRRINREEARADTCFLLSHIGFIWFEDERQSRDATQASSGVLNVTMSSVYGRAVVY